MNAGAALRLLAFLLVTAVCGLFAAEPSAPLDLVGVMETKSDGVALMFQNTVTGENSPWTKVGDTMRDGYKVASFSAKDDVATLTRGSSSLILKIRQPITRIGAPPDLIPGTFTFKEGTGDSTRNTRVITQLAIGQVSRVELGFQRAMEVFPTRAPDGNHLYRVAFIAPDASGKSEWKEGPSVVVLPGKDFSLTIGEINLSFTVPKPTPSP